MNNIDIPKRDLRFDLDEVDLSRWHAAGLHTSHFFNALSLFFPEGESFFIDSARRYARRIESPELADELRGFSGQEAMHSREHRRYNRALAKAGLPAKQLERVVDRVLEAVRRVTTPGQQLAATIALEHFTAIMADVALSNDGVLDADDPRMAALWRWHAIEETEHKAVAFDVYRTVRGAGAGSYFERAISMLLATAIFWPLVIAFHLRLVHADGALGDLRGWGRFFRFAFLSPGFLSRLVLPWTGYFRPGFHPWQHDNSKLVEAWRAAGGDTELTPA